MGAIGLLGVLTHRRRHAMPALSATVLALMIVAPQMAVDLGFALSVSATAALVVIAPGWSGRLVARGWPKPLADAVCVATAAQLVTAPLVAAITGRLSVVSIVANVAVTAVIPPITVAGTAAAALAPLWPGAAQLLIRFTGPELWWLLHVARWAGGDARRDRARCRRGCPAWCSSPARRSARCCCGGVARARLRRRPPMKRSWGEPRPGLHLVLGDEELLVERAIAAVLRDARAHAGTDDVPVNRLRAGEVTTNELAELLSPSLFADERVVVLESAAEAGKDAAALIASAAADLPPGTVLVVVHSGGGRAKALADELRKLGAQVHPCARITKAAERADFVRAEFRCAAGSTSTTTWSAAMIDAVGSDLRELAAACSQLVADTGGDVDVGAVRRYYSGKAEVTGFDIADKAVVGDVAGAVEALRWAMMRGVPHVVLADALAEAVHTIARVGPLSGDPYRLAAELGMPPWRVQKAQKQARGWSRSRWRGDAAGRDAECRRQGRSGRRRLRAGGDDATVARTGRAAPVDQSLLRASASADFLLAAWFLWMTPLLAALSSLRLVASPARRPCPCRRSRRPHGTRGSPCEATTSPTCCAVGGARWCDCASPAT